MTFPNQIVRLVDKSARKLRALHLDYLVLLPLIFFICSQTIVPLPFSPVPVSLQPLPVFLAAWFFGWRGVAGYTVYLVQGGLGAPIFSGFSGGLFHLLGPTGGYLGGFLLGAIVITILKTKNSPTLEAYGLYIFATLATFFCGITHLCAFIPFSQAIAHGLAPFIIGDFVLKPLLFAISTRLKK